MNAAEKIGRDNFGSLDENLSAFEALGQKNHSEGGMALDRINYPQKKLVAARQTRDAITSLGLSPSSIEYMSESESKREGGKVAMAYYDESTNKIGSVGLHVLMQGALSAGMSTRTYVSKLMLHELEHQTSRRARGARQTDALFTYLLGREGVHISEEANAGQHTEFDAYYQEKQAMQSLATRLKSSYKELLLIRRTGNHRKLLKLAIEAGLYNPDPANGGGYSKLAVGS